MPQTQGNLSCLSSRTQSNKTVAGGPWSYWPVKLIALRAWLLCKLCSTQCGLISTNTEGCGSSFTAPLSYLLSHPIGMICSATYLDQETGLLLGCQCLEVGRREQKLVWLVMRISPCALHWTGERKREANSDSGSLGVGPYADVLQSLLILFYHC